MRYQRDRPVLPATLLVLAGGQSRRMGRPKALLPVGSITLIEWIVERLAPSFQHLCVAAGDELQLPPGLRPRLVKDLHAGSGPLAGIEAGLAASPFDTVVALACDMPHVTAELVARLVTSASDAEIDAAVPRVGGRPQPTCAAYRRSAAASIAESIKRGHLEAARVLNELRVTWLDDADAGLFANINTPDDYQAFLKRVRRGGLP